MTIFPEDMEQDLQRLNNEIDQAWKDLNDELDKEWTIHPEAWTKQEESDRK